MYLINKILFFILLSSSSRGYILNNFNNDLTRIQNDNQQRSQPPPHTEYAKMARYVVHNSDWTAMGTISSLKDLQGFPMVNVISIADSPRGGNSTGNIYFYLTMLDFTGQDLENNNRLTMLLSMDQNQYCTNKNIDPMEPTCARIMLSGRIVKPDNTTDDYEFGKRSMISRHPAAIHWLEAHDFYLCRLVIEKVTVLDWYGGPHFVSIQDYYNVTENNYNQVERKIKKKHSNHRRISVITV